jgi:hypothetical protein
MNPMPAIDLRAKLARIAEPWTPRVVVVPRGREHITRAPRGCQALIIEPRGVRNTGDAPGALTAPQDAWI